MLAGVIVASVCTAFLYRRQTRGLETSAAAAQQRLAEVSARLLWLGQADAWLRHVRPALGFPSTQADAGWAAVAPHWRCFWTAPRRLTPAPTPRPPHPPRRQAAASSITNMRTVRIFAGEALEAQRFGRQVAAAYAGGLGFARAKAMLESEWRRARMWWVWGQGGTASGCAVQRGPGLSLARRRRRPKPEHRPRPHHPARNAAQA